MVALVEPPMLPKARAAIVTLALAALAFVVPLPAAAQDPNVHPFQKMDARIVWTGGTEDRVEIRVEGMDLPTTVLMRDENGNWADMHDSDGDFNNDHLERTGYRVEPGNHVWFRFGWSVPKDFVREDSCAYDHEGFARDCSLSQPPLPPVDLRFDHLGGNEWWVDLQMLGSTVESLGDYSVWLKDDQGGSATMRRLGPGHYGEGLRVTPGTRVMFETYIPERESIRSCWFVHPSGLEQCDGGKVTPAAKERFIGGDGRITLWSSVERFEHMKVSEWWVETQVTPLNNQHWDWQQAQVRVNGGAWNPLTFRSWGAWATSVHVPAGAVVQFRAYDAKEGVWDYSVGSWKVGAPAQHAPSLDAPWQVVFANAKGNAWWVQVNPYSDEFFPRVQARAEGGAWRELQFKDWGDWAASFNVPAGKRVQFQAIREDGTAVQSGWIAWPPPA